MAKKKSHDGMYVIYTNADGEPNLYVGQSDEEILLKLLKWFFSVYEDPEIIKELTSVHSISELKSYLLDCGCLGSIDIVEPK